MPQCTPAWPSDSEIGGRIGRLKDNMAKEGIDAMVITSQFNFEYYTGFRTLFWLSDSRPLLAIARLDKPGIAFVAARFEERNEYCGRIAGVHPVFYDGFTETALQTAGNFLEGLKKESRIGFDYGRDMFGRGSIALVDFLRQEPRSYRLVDAADVIWRQRLIKSDHEIEAVRTACHIATDAFFAGLSDLRIGMTEWEFGQVLKQRMIGLGAESVDWIPVRFGAGGKSYGQPNSDVRLQQNDFVWSDIGVRRADQISDLNRVAKVGKATAEQEDIYGFVRSVTLRLAEAIRPGMTGHDAYMAFEKLWAERNFSRLKSAGRVGHGSGIALTEPPSLMADSTEIIEENMVLHVEPKLEVAGGVFQVEEVFRVTPNGPDFLSDISPAKLPIVEL
jgi:Xaa-Pro dipeptidase